MTEVIAELSVPEVKAPEGSVAQIFEYLEAASDPQAASVTLAETRTQYINGEIVEALMGCAITRREALAVLKAILAGHIPHVTITY
jgi:hypothetical protein